MIELRQFLTPPEWMHSDITGMLREDCHVTITWSAVDTATNTVIGRPGRHRAVMRQQADGTWDWHPAPINPDTNQPFVFEQALMDRLRSDIAGDVARRGVVPAVLTPVNNGDGTATVTAVFYRKDDAGKYQRTMQACVTPIGAPDLAELEPVLPPELILRAKEYIRSGIA